jgi:hypothetical protein
MTDSSRKTPPLGMKKPTRMQSQDDRDAEGLAARREREAVVKESSSDEITGRYEGEALDEKRAERDDIERIVRLEKKHDSLKKDVQKKHEELKGDVKELRGDVKQLSGEFSDLRAEVSGAVGDLRSEVSGAVGKIDGQSGVLSEMLGLVRKTAEQSVEHERVSFTAKVEVDKAHELAKVEVDKEQQLAAIEVTKEATVDNVKAKADRRKRNLKLLGLIASGGSIVELIHRLWEWLT